MNDETKIQYNIPSVSMEVSSIETNERIVDVLNSLVQTNNDRIESYGLAANETSDEDLNKMFNAMMAQSQMLKSQLVNKVRKFGGEPTERTSTMGKAFSAWMDFKAMVTGKDRKAILNSCEYSEYVAQDAYANAIRIGSELPVEILNLIMEQKVLLNLDHNRVKAIRGTACDFIL